MRIFSKAALGAALFVLAMGCGSDGDDAEGSGRDGGTGGGDAGLDETGDDMDGDGSVNTRDAADEDQDGGDPGGGAAITGSGTWDGKAFTVKCEMPGASSYGEGSIAVVREAACQASGAGSTFTGPVNQVNLYFSNAAPGTYTYEGPTATPSVNSSYVAITGDSFQQNATTRANFASGMLVLEELTTTRMKGSFEGTWNADDARPASTVTLTFDVALKPL